MKKIKNERSSDNHGKTDLTLLHMFPHVYFHHNQTLLASTCINVLAFRAIRAYSVVRVSTWLLSAQSLFTSCARLSCWYSCCCCNRYMSYRIHNPLSQGLERSHTLGMKDQIHRYCYAWAFCLKDFLSTLNY